MSYTTTTNLSLQKAVPGSNQAFETTSINANWDAVDTAVGATNTVVAGHTTSIGSLNTSQAAQDATLSSYGTRITALENEGALSSKSASYTLVAGDANRTIAFTGSSAQTLTIPAVFAVDGDRVDVLRNGTGTLTFAASGVTLQSKSGYLSVSTQYSAASIIRISASVYQIIGDLA